MGENMSSVIASNCTLSVEEHPRSFGRLAFEKVAPRGLCVRALTSGCWFTSVHVSLNRGLRRLLAGRQSTFSSARQLAFRLRYL